MPVPKKTGLAKPFSCVPPKPTAPPAFRPQPVPKVLQKKAAVSRQPQKPQPRVTPTAPPVYRPQPTRGAVQANMAAAAQLHVTKTKTAPVAPPVYRPQSLPKVLQKKSVRHGPLTSGSAKPASPAAPAVYRPQPIPKVLQKKSRPGVAHTPRANTQRPKQTIQRYCDGRPLPDLARNTAAQSIKGRSRTIQRKVGFELEMSVPTFGKPAAFHPQWFKDMPKGNALEFIETFLFGGLPYGSDIGENDDFRLTSDHNRLQAKGSAILNKLHEMGYLLRFPQHGEYKTVSNLEYVTKALDELAPNSTTAFQTQFNAMKNHMKTVWTDAKTTMKLIHAPAKKCATGVPVAELKQWLGAEYKQIEPLIKDFQDTMKDQLYLQATVGVIPSALRDLHVRQVPDSDDDKTVWDEATQGVDAYVNKVVKDLLDADDPYVKDLATPPSDIFSFKKHGVEIEAFKGLLFMTLMYMVGNAINQTDILEQTAKNAVPFLSKMNLGQIQGTAMTIHQGGILGERPPEGTIKKIVAAFKAFNATKADQWVAHRGVKLVGTGERASFIPDDEAFIRGVLEGKNVQAIITGPTRQLKADVLPKEVEKASAGQKGITVEYRKIRERPTPDNLAAPLMKIVREVRELNTKHLSAEAKKRIIDAADK